MKLKYNKSEIAEHIIIVSLFHLGTVVLGLLIGGMLPAWAGTQLFDPQNTSTVINSNAQLIQGISERNSTNTQAIPFIAQVYSSGNECVRLEVTDQGAQDLEIVLVSPDGLVWRDDDSAGNNRPLVKAITNVDGWYTVHVSQYAGGCCATVFQLRYGRYNNGNPNCASPTQLFNFN
jgi:hypothetical protein